MKKATLFYGILAVFLLLATNSVVSGQDCLSGTVFTDANNNGILDGGETGIGGLTVVAISNGGAVLNATTAANGYYEFCMPPAGDYYLYVQLSSPDLESNPPTHSATFAVGMPVTGLDFGIINRAELGVIAGQAFYDLNADGLQDPNEPSLVGIAVTLTGGLLTGPVVVSTDAFGRFRFEELPTGAYVATVDVLLPNTEWAGGAALNVDLAAGQVVNNLRFARQLLPGFSALVDFVCFDLNGDALNDPATEPGIPDVSVELFDAQGISIGTTRSDARGVYGFAGLPPGTYRVRPLFEPAQYTATTPTEYTLTLPIDSALNSGPFYFQPRRKLFGCGMTATTFLGDYSNGYDLGNGGRVLAIKDTRDRSVAPSGVPMHWGAVVDIDHPDWREAKIGQVFGAAIGHDDFLYVTATRLYGNADLSAGNGLAYAVHPFTGGVNTFLTASAAPTAVGANQLFSNNRGLGNVCYNRADTLLYITNLADGTINVVAALGSTLNTPGTVLQSYSVTSFSALALANERVWGVGFDEAERQVYFSTPATGSVSIIRVPVDGAGLISGGETVAFSVGNTSVADIAFAHDSQRMLLSERGNPHASRVFQYAKTGPGAWSSPQEIYVGGYNLNQNAAGGVDYAYASFSANQQQPDTCDTYIAATGNALILGGGEKVYGFAIIPDTGNVQGSFADLNSVFIDSDVEVGAANLYEWDKGDLGDVEVFDCACGELPPPPPPPGEGCGGSGLLITQESTSDTLGDCCVRLNYTNADSTEIYGIEIELLDGLELADGYTVGGGLITPNFSPTGLTITPDDFGPLPDSIPGLLDFCLVDRFGTPQYYIVHFLDADYQRFCSDTLAQECALEAGCLQVFSDSLSCDSMGYLYTITVQNPSGGDFDIGRIKLEVTGPDTASIDTSYVVDFTTPLAPGDQATLDFLILTDLNLAGDSLCIILTAHDGPAERLCCFARDTCFAFPDCGPDDPDPDPETDPCDAVSSQVRPTQDQQAELCCFELIVSDTLSATDTTVFSAIQTTILNPGVSFSGLATLPALAAGWRLTILEAGRDLRWTRAATDTLPRLDNFNLFDFCVEGTTTTDSVYIQVSWLGSDSATVCSDTLAVYCPYCITVVNGELACATNADGTQDYVYTFQVENFSPFPGNTIAVVEVPFGSTNISPDAVSIPTVAAFPPGGTSVPVSFVIDGAIEPTDSFCIDVVLRQVIADSVNITCCYATHCFELPVCDSLPTFVCPNPDLATNNDCAAVWEPVCGCDSMTYANTCYALNAGVIITTPGLCDSLAADPGINTTAELDTAGNVLVRWTIPQADAFDFFVVQRRAPGGAFVTLGTVVSVAGQTNYGFVDEDPLTGANEYLVIGVDAQGKPRAGNVASVFVLAQRSQAEVSVYAFPVPARDVVQVVANRSGEATIEVISADGRNHLQQRARFGGEPVPVTISRLSEGVYTLRLRFDDGETGVVRIVRFE